MIKVDKEYLDNMEVDKDYLDKQWMYTYSALIEKAATEVSQTGQVYPQTQEVLESVRQRLIDRGLI